MCRIIADLRNGGKINAGSQTSIEVLEQREAKSKSQLESTSIPWKSRMQDIYRIRRR